MLMYFQLNALVWSIRVDVLSVERLLVSSGDSEARAN